jgi:hypothetical protein
MPSSVLLPSTPTNVFFGGWPWELRLRSLRDGAQSLSSPVRALQVDRVTRAISCIAGRYATPTRTRCVTHLIRFK